MKSKIMWIVIPASVASAILASCNTHQKSSEEAAANNGDTAIVMTDTTNMAQKEWEKFKTDAIDKIKENTDSMEAFKARINKEGKKAGKGLDKEIDKLKERNDELKTRLDTFKMESKEKWAKFKQDFNNDMDTLGMKLREITKKV